MQNVWYNLFMPRPSRTDVADGVYHVINRRVGSMPIFKKKADYLVFEKLLEDCVTVRDMRIIAYCLMPNHWHLLLQPRYDGHMAKVLHWLTTTHTRRWHTHTKTIGEGALYQGRYKSFPVETNKYLLQVIRYIEKNPLRANLVPCAEDWEFSSFYKRNNKRDSWLSNTIVELPNNYRDWLHAQDDESTEQIRASVKRGIPYGSDMWVFETIEKFGLQSTVTEIGRPRKY